MSTPAEKSRQRYYARRDSRIDAGLCIQCGSNPNRERRQKCQPCQDKDTLRNRVLRLSRIENRLCARCKSNLKEDDQVHCASCKIARRLYEDEYYSRNVKVWRRRKAQKRVYHVTNRDQRNFKAAELLKVKKAQVIREYGGECACCGEDDMAFLSIDHIYGDGAEHRRNLDCAAGTNFYHYLIVNGFPDKDRLQVLCHNCNVAKGRGATCPHQLYKAFVDDRQILLPFDGDVICD